MTKQATLNNETVTIIATNGGWTTVQLPDGAEKKVRNGALTVVIGEDRRKQDHETVIIHQPKKETAMEAQAETTETKKPTPPGREARPAHFVGEVAPGKVAKIKDTNFDLSRYFVSDIKTPTGRRTIDCADDVASRLRGLPIDQVYVEAAEALETTVEALSAQYAHLNIGMQRMNLGNRIRGAAAAAAKAEEKAQKEAERAAQKEAAAAAKAEEKAQKEAERAEAKAARDAEKAAARTQKEAERAAKKAEKEAAKAE